MRWFARWWDFREEYDRCRLTLEPGDWYCHYPEDLFYKPSKNKRKKQRKQEVFPHFEGVGSSKVSEEELLFCLFRLFYAPIFAIRSENESGWCGSSVGRAKD